ncbi:hypothetical protein N9891_01225 [bacterium]|nr:hypothetical protein [bacterium]
MAAKINIVSFAGALFLFFVPWLDFQCSGKTMITQSGFQAVYGGGSVDPQFESASKKDSEKEKKDGKKKGPGMAYLLGVAFVAIVAGLIVSLFMFRKSAAKSKIASALAALALILIALQMMLGFPMEQEITKSMAEQNDENAGGIFFAQLNLGIVYRPWIYLELAFLACPLAVAFFRMQPKRAEVPSENPEVEL